MIRCSQKKGDEEMTRIRSPTKKIGNPLLEQRTSQKRNTRKCVYPTLQVEYSTFSTLMKGGKKDVFDSY